MTPEQLRSHAITEFSAIIRRQHGKKRYRDKFVVPDFNATNYTVSMLPGTQKRPHEVRCTRRVYAGESGPFESRRHPLAVFEEPRLLVYDGSGHNQERLIDELVGAILADRVPTANASTVDPEANEQEAKVAKKSNKAEEPAVVSGSNTEGQREQREAQTAMMEPESQMTTTTLPATLPLSAIYDRPAGDTRKLDVAHVVSMAETIAAVGLVQPLVVDRVGHLLAGGHRRAAIRLLLVEDPEERVLALEGQYGPLPGRIKQELEERTRALNISPDVGALDPVKVHIMDFDAEDEPERALGVEAAENAQRKQYTTREVKGIYDRLIEAGFTDRRGKPAKGEKAAKPAVAAIIGKSTRTVHRMLEHAEKKQSLNMTSAGLRIVETAERRLAGVVKDLRQWADEHGKKAPDEVHKLLFELDAPGIERMLKAAKEALGWKEPEKAGKDTKGKKSRAKVKDKPKKANSKRTYTQAAPTNEQLDTWAGELGVEIPDTVDRRNRWGRYRALAEAAAEPHGVDLAGLPEGHWKDGELPALEMVRANGGKRRKSD